jgi:AraC-like DNA-binding protein
MLNNLAAITDSIDRAATVKGHKLLGTIPTAGGGIARAACARAARMRLPTGPLIKHSGLTSSQLNDPSGRITVNQQIKLLNVIAETLPDESLGFHLAHEIELREIGLLYYVQASSESLGEALQRVTRYCSIQNEGVRLSYQRGEDVTLALKYENVRRLSDRHQMECFVTLVVRGCRQLTGRHLLPTRIELAHRRSVVPSEIRHFFGCEVVFGGEADEIHFSFDTAQLPIASADMHLNKLLIKYCEEALSKRRLVAKNWRLSVENLLAQLLPHGQATLSEVSRRLGVTERTLMRRLEAEGLTFSGVLDDLRFELAKRYLKEPQLPISRTAWLVGYRDPSAFCHAFKRRSGQSPRQARQ